MSFTNLPPADSLRPLKSLYDFKGLVLGMLRIPQDESKRWGLSAFYTLEGGIRLFDVPPFKETSNSTTDFCARCVCTKNPWYSAKADKKNK